MLRCAPILILLLAGCALPVDDTALDGEGSSQRQPAMSWSVSQSSVTATVVSADPGANWRDFGMTFSRAGQLSGDAGEHDIGTEYQQLADRNIGAGNSLSFCVDGASGSLEATLRHIPSSSIAREFIFASAKPC